MVGEINVHLTECERNSIRKVCKVRSRGCTFLWRVSEDFCRGFSPPRHKNAGEFCTVFLCCIFVTLEGCLVFIVDLNLRKYWPFLSG